MQRFECSGCGGTLRENGRFFVCEYCGSIYLLGMDDEGNRFAYQAIEKKEISHGEMAEKATKIEAHTI